MKKTIMICLAIALVITIAACAAKTTDITEAETAKNTEQATPELTEEPAPTPEPTPTPTPKPTPTPEPTLSPEEIAIQAEYELYKRYWEEYEDEHARPMIQQMVNEGMITQEMFDDVFGEIPYTEEAPFEWEMEMVEGFSSMLNGTYDSDPKYWIDAIAHTMRAGADAGRLHIILLDTQEKRDRAERVIIAINAWCDNPTDETREHMEELIFDENLTCSESILIDSWFWYNPNRPAYVRIGDVKYEAWEYYELELEKYGCSIFKEGVKAYEDLETQAR